MRPIQLKVAGLHSFREQQEVNFENLCSGGVFGIFGPTGSGKSSLLDAMTLALYGKVERANNNTQGIMNQFEDQLSVSFTFELGNADGLKRYRVERRYKRTDEVRLKTVTCRFIEISGEEHKVMADKERDVTQCVQNVLGLTVDDFTRAVVLPQGKFAEFLSLKGSERRQMLQRLFHLEKYGDVLNIKLKKRYVETKSSVDQILAEQQGLGEASAENVKLAKKRSEQAEATLKIKQKQLQKAEEAAERDRRIWELQEEKKNVEQAIARHRERQEEILAMEKRLQEAELAEKLRPYAEELDRSNSALAHWKQEVAKTEAVLAQARKSYEHSFEEWNAARAELTAEEPRLTVRMEQLTRARQLQSEITSLRHEIEEQKKVVLQCITVYEEKQNKWQEALQWKEKALKKQAELQEALQQKTVKSAERQHVTSARQAAQALQNERHLFETAQQEITGKTKAASELEQRVKKAAGEIGTLQEHIGRSIHNTATLHHEVCESDTRIEHVLVLIPELLEEQKQELARHTRNQLAAQLVQQLQTDESCPVCGSREHPHPAEITVHSESANDVEDCIARLDALFQQAAGLKQDGSGLTYRLEQLSQSFGEIIGDSSDAAAADAALDLAPSAPANTDGRVGWNPEFTVPEKIEYLTGELSFISDRIRYFQEEMARQEAACRNSAREYTRLRQQQAEMQISYDLEVKALQERKTKQQVLAEEMAAMEQNWRERFSPLTLDGIEQAAAHIDARDQEVEGLQERLNKSVPYIEQKEQEIVQLQQELGQLEKDRVRLDTELAGKAGNLAEKQTCLTEIAGAADVHQLLAETEERLRAIRSKAKEKEEKAAIMQKEQQTAERAESAARQSFLLAEKRQAEASVSWNTACSETPFQSREHVTAALADISLQEKWRASIMSYRDDEKKLLHQISLLVMNLDDAVLAEEQWLHTKAQLQQAREEAELATNEKIRAERDYEDIERRHARWTELEQQNSELQQVLNRLQSLQGVFRGNGFVEFIAEEQLMQVSYEASMRLGKLTRQRYAIEVDSTGGFVIRDDANGGTKRPVTTLSGGETFLTSLALALALSTQIQLRGEFPLEFFFLDEGFGTLDQELLDTVVTALEKLHTDRLSVGIISHVPELRARLPRRLLVIPAEHSGRGSSVSHEVL